MEKKPQYAVMLDCRTETKRLTDSTSGCYWEDEYHIITFVVEEDRAKADEIVMNQLKNTREVRSAWVENRYKTKECEVYLPDLK